MKTCIKCGLQKSLEDFHRHRQSSQGRRGTCKLCIKEYGKLYRATEPVHLKTARAIAKREGWLRRKYGIDLQIFEKLLDAQGGVCALCKTTEPGGQYSVWVVDHCHDTGRVRGLLCHSCNISLGTYEALAKTAGTAAIAEYLTRNPLASGPSNTRKEDTPLTTLDPSIWEGAVCH